MSRIAPNLVHDDPQTPLLTTFSGGLVILKDGKLIWEDEIPVGVNAQPGDMVPESLGILQIR